MTKDLIFLPKFINCAKCGHTAVKTKMGEKINFVWTKVCPLVGAISLLGDKKVFDLLFTAATNCVLFQKYNLLINSRF